MHKRAPRRGVTKPQSWGPRLDHEQPRWTRFTGRSGRLPLTLVDGSTRANLARDLQVVAAAIHFARPCYSELLQRIAYAAANSLTPAGQILADTATPSANALLTEVTLTEPTFTESSLVEGSSPP